MSRSTAHMNERHGPLDGPQTKEVGPRARLKSLSQQLRSHPSETMHAFKALFACNRRGHGCDGQLGAES